MLKEAVEASEHGKVVNGILFGRGVRGIIEGDSVPHEFIPRLIAQDRRRR